MDEGFDDAFPQMGIRMIPSYVPPRLIPMFGKTDKKVRRRGPYPSRLDIPKAGRVKTTQKQTRPKGTRAENNASIGKGANFPSKVMSESRMRRGGAEVRHTNTGLKHAIRTRTSY